MASVEQRAQSLKRIMIILKKPHAIYNSRFTYGMLELQKILIAEQHKKPTLYNCI